VVVFLADPVVFLADPVVFFVAPLAFEAALLPVSAGLGGNHTALVALAFATNEAPRAAHVSLSETRFQRLLMSIIDCPSWHCSFTGAHSRGSRRLRSRPGSSQVPNPVADLTLKSISGSARLGHQLPCSHKPGGVIVVRDVSPETLAIAPVEESRAVDFPEAQRPDPPLMMRRYAHCGTAPCPRSDASIARLTRVSLAAALLGAQREGTTEERRSEHGFSHVRL